MPGQNLTRLEAAERSATVRTQSYDIVLDLTRGETVFGSTTTARFTATPGSSTFIDLVAPTVRSITLNGTPLDPAEVYADSRIALKDLAADNELVVVADCAYMRTGEGLHAFLQYWGAAQNYMLLTGDTDPFMSLPGQEHFSHMAQMYRDIYRYNIGWLVSKSNHPMCMTSTAGRRP